MVHRTVKVTCQVNTSVSSVSQQSCPQTNALHHTNVRGVDVWSTHHVYVHVISRTTVTLGRLAHVKILLSGIPKRLNYSITGKRGGGPLVEHLWHKASNSRISGQLTENYVWSGRGLLWGNTVNPLHSIAYVQISKWSRTSGLWSSCDAVSIKTISSDGKHKKTQFDCMELNFFLQTRSPVTVLSYRRCNNISQHLASYALRCWHSFYIRRY
jgi:hypothetical protein